MISTRTETAVLVTAAGARYPLDLVDGQIGLNEGSAPYAVTSIRIHRPPVAVLALIDPDTRPRVRLTLTSNGATRVHDLLVDARQIVAGESTVGINLVSDERVIMDYASVATTDDRTLWARQASAMSIVRAVLQKVLGTGYNLVTGVTDAAFPTYSESRNLIPSGNSEYGIGPWQGTAATVAASTNFHQLGAFSLQVVPQTSSNDSFAYVDPGMRPGTTYTISGYVRVAVAQGNTFPGRARGISIMAEDAGGQRIIASSNQGANTSDTTSRVSLTFTTPENMLESHVRLYDGAAINGGGAAVYWDAVIMVEGDGTDTNGAPMTYWDGDSTNPAYVYTWDGDQGNSASTRKPLVARDPDVLTWSPGQTAWDLLSPILPALGWRLWCDEARVWHLTDNDYALDRVVVIAAGDNLYSHTDLKSRTASQPDGAPLYIDAVMVKYTWTDARGTEQTRYDVYTPPGFTRPHLVELTDTPYPGPGAARYLYARYAARRRQIAVAARVDYAVSPGMQASITVPEMDAQTGYLDSVSWSLGSDEMTVVTKNLVSTPPTAYVQQPDSMTYGSLADSVTYSNFQA